MSVRKIARNRVDLLYELIKTNFKMRYYNSILGVLWVLIRPYTIFLTMYVLWSNTSIARSEGIGNYSLYLLTGIVFYTYANEVVIYGHSALLDKAGIILKVNFPRQVAVVAALSNAVINFFINLAFVFLIMFLTGGGIFNLQSIVGLLIVFSIMFLWGFGLALFASVISVRFRDLKNILELGMFLMLYASPIFYDPQSFFGETTVSRLIAANPLGVLINQARAALGVFGEINYGILIAYTIGGIIFAVVGSLYFDRAVKRVAEHF